jgi:O-antigen ligase
MTILVSIIVILRVLFWHLFPVYGTGLNSELIFTAMAMCLICAYRVIRADSPFRWPIFFFCLVMLIQLFISPNKVSAVSFAFYQTIGIMLFSLISTRQREIFPLKHVMMAVFLLIAIKSLAELPYIARPASFLGWPTATASCLLIALPWAFCAKRWVVFGVLLAGFLATKSIMPVISLAIVACIATNRPAVLVAFSLVMAVIVARGDILASIGVRMSYHDTVIAWLQHHWLMGSGPGTFKIDGLSPTAYAHNSYLQIWSEMGILGGAAIFAFVYKFWQTRVNSGLFFGLLAFLIDNMTNFTLLRPASSMIFWIMLGVYVYERKDIKK